MKILRDKKGILLVEVLIAVSVMAVALTMIARSFTNCLRVLENADDYNTAVILADEVFAELIVLEADDWPSKGKFKDYPEFTWTMETGDFETDDFDEWELKNVQLTIHWKRRNREYKLTVPTRIHVKEIL